MVVLAALAGLGLAATPSPAYAAAVADAGALKLALSSGTDPVISLTQDVTVLDAVLTIPRSVTLDLAGSDLTTYTITLAAGVTFTITDSTAPATRGTFTATSSAASRPGIGTNGATLIIDEGHVVAGGGTFSAAIGGSQNNGGGTIVIDGGVVEATGGATGGAGIGAGWGGSGTDITIRDGDITAVGGYNAAGIGGGGGNPAGSGLAITIEGGVIDARGGDQGGTGIGSGVCGRLAGSIEITGGQIVAAAGPLHGPGIGFSGGCGGGAAMGTIVIDGGDITATGGEDAGGIGFRDVSAGGSLRIDSGTVVATGGARGPGLGNPFFASTVEIGSSATVTARAGAGGFAVDSTSYFGTLTVAGELILPAGSTLTIPAGKNVTVAASGVITGPGTLAGAGRVDNLGSITLADASVTVASITGHHYQVAFDTQDPSAPVPSTRRVLAATFDDGDRTFVADPVSTLGSFYGWNTSADGTGSAFTTTSVIPGSATGAALPVTVFAQWSSYLVLTPADPTVSAGDVVAFQVDAYAAGGAHLGDVSAQSTLVTSNGAADTVTGASILFTVAGATPADVTTVTATLTADASVTGSTDVTVEPGEAVALAMIPSATAVDQGDTITVAVSGDDAYGNPIPDLATEVDLTSDHPSDRISGMSVSFPSASTHVITATLRSDPAVSAATSITVRPAAGTVALTGADPLPAIAVALGLLLLGSAAVVVARLSRRGSLRSR
ncbi:MAG TPA: hypothetical protein VNR36_04640 [Pseudolysinimonas sp.]|nr:hypothetical protein [Pseudolysinimonas sp.]